MVIMKLFLDLTITFLNNTTTTTITMTSLTAVKGQSSIWSTATVNVLHPQLRILLRLIKTPRTHRPLLRL